jgi:hypothetical protein
MTKCLVTPTRDRRRIRVGVCCCWSPRRYECGELDRHFRPAPWDSPDCACETQELLTRLEELERRDWMDEHRRVSSTYHDGVSEPVESQTSL